MYVYVYMDIHGSHSMDIYGYIYGTLSHGTLGPGSYETLDGTAHPILFMYLHM